MTELGSLPEGLTVPVDDGAADHLTGMMLPDIKFACTDATLVDLTQLEGRWVIYTYPMTGRPGVPLPPDWDEIPGARGCTPQSCSFRDHYAELQSLQTGVDQIEARDRLHLPFQLLSDCDLELKALLRMPTYTADGLELYKRLTLIITDGLIDKVFYPVFPPDRNIDEMLAWLKSGK